MLILGITGGFDLQYQRNQGPIFVGRSKVPHDTAAVLVENGKVVGGIEEERLIRIPHTGKAPLSAIRFCLDSFGVQLSDIDKIAFYGEEKIQNISRRLHFLADFKKRELVEVRTDLHRMFTTACGQDFSDDKLVFVPHHLAHAMSAFFMSGFSRSLILTLDGFDDNISGTLLEADRTTSNQLATFSIANSLGQYYLAVIKYLGYGPHEEYKVMELAASGNSDKYESMFKSFYTLLPDGNFNINSNYITLLYSVMNPRKRSEPITQVHQDVAAALQKSLEEIVLHILNNYKKKTNNVNLCIAGGVAQNSFVNGAILYSGLFENVFIQPAADDAGCAIGAALYEYYKDKPQAPCAKLENMYWGTVIGNKSSIDETLHKWNQFIESESIANLPEAAAKMLADGSVIGWVQGKAGFGPQAYENRSIIADPRRIDNRDQINEIVKSQGGHPPLVPAILAEYVWEFFEKPMMAQSISPTSIALKLRPEKGQLFGAVPRFNGKAQVQVISRETNPLYWQVIDEFRKITGIPFLLGAPLHNNHEPVVNSVNDAIVCFLTTHLNQLIIGEYLIKKRASVLSDYFNMIPNLPAHVVLKHTKRYTSLKETTNVYEIFCNEDDGLPGIGITNDTYQVLKKVDGRKNCRELLMGLASKQVQDGIMDEIMKLWVLRLVTLTP